MTTPQQDYYYEQNHYLRIHVARRSAFILLYILRRLGVQSSPFYTDRIVDHLQIMHLDSPFSKITYR